MAPKVRKWKGVASGGHVQDAYRDLLIEIDYVKRVVASGRIGVPIPAVAVQRAMEAVASVEGAWSFFGRMPLPEVRRVLCRMLDGERVEPSECVEAVLKLSNLLQRHERGHHRAGKQRHFAFQ